MTTSPRRPEPEIEVRAERLADEYHRDPGAADRAYKGRRLRVADGIDRVAPTHAAYVRPVMVRSDARPDVHFAFAAGGDLARLAPHRVHVIEGTCRGLEGGAVVLADCVLVAGA